MPILVNLAKQQLHLCDANHRIITTYPISTATNGAGEKMGSYQTPRGRHVIYQKIGENREIYTVFSSRKTTGERWSKKLQEEYPARDWILTRILWLSGLEKNYNLGGDVDTKARYIYIHGTAEEDKIGQPCSHGCIRMRNQDVIELFDKVLVGESVMIEEAR